MQTSHTGGTRPRRVAMAGIWSQCSRVRGRPCPAGRGTKGERTMQTAGTRDDPGPPPVRAEAQAGRAPGSVTLVAVSKVQPEDRVRAVLAAGQRVFGENRVQEAQTRWDAARAEVAGDRPPPDRAAPDQQGARGRGALRHDPHARPAPPRRDAGAAGAGAGRLARALRAGQHRPGAAEGRRARPRRPTALRRAARALDLPVRGLMCIPPEGEDPVPHFRTLRGDGRAQRPALACRWA